MSLSNLPALDEQFRRLRLPDGPFMIEDQDGDMDGPYDPQDFITDEQGVAIVSPPDASHPIFLRVLEQDGNEVTVVDGEGSTWHYTFHPLATA